MSTNNTRTRNRPADTDDGEQKHPDWWIENADGTVTVVLDDTIELAGVPTGSLKMRRPRVKDRMAIERDRKLSTDGDREIVMFGNLTDLAPNEIEELTMSDYKRLQEVFTSFLSSETRPK